MKRTLRLLFLTFCLSANAVNITNIWDTLQSGNRKYLKNKTYARERAATAPGQNPMIVVLSCADSRVPPEIVFTQGIGDLFVCRVAGEVVDQVVVDSIEYAISHYDVMAIVVLGHTHCGAVTGAIKHLIANGGVIDHIEEGHLNAVLIPIEIAILQAGIDYNSPNALNLSIQANIAYVADQLQIQSTLITEEIETGSLCIIGAEYDLSSGQVQELFTIPRS